MTYSSPPLYPRSMCTESWHSLFRECRDEPDGGCRGSSLAWPTYTLASMQKPKCCAFLFVACKFVAKYIPRPAMPLPACPMSNPCAMMDLPDAGDVWWYKAFVPPC